MAYLTVRIKEVEGHTTQELTGGERLTLGRSSSTDIPIRHESISREHCRFILQDGVWHVEDAGSANGTKVGHDKIEGRVALKERDIIRVGKARLTFHAGSRASAPHSVDSEGGAAINLDDDGSAAPVRRTGPDEPPEAIPCTHCKAWFSVAHRLPGDRMPCPRCEKQNTVPSFALAGE